MCVVNKGELCCWRCLMEGLNMGVGRGVGMVVGMKVSRDKEWKKWLKGICFGR